jgi:hypothetical protein
MAHIQQGRRSEPRRGPTGQAGQPGQTGQAGQPGQAGQAAAGTQQVAAQHGAHGQSVASWTAVGTIMFGALIMAIAVVISTVWLFVVGAVVVVLGAIAGKVLSAMGFGVSGKPSR